MDAAALDGGISRRVQPRTCGPCGVSFTPERNRQVFCSRRCMALNRHGRTTADQTTAPRAGGTCRHCRRVTTYLKCNGFCSGCYNDPRVRHSYPAPRRGKPPRPVADHFTAAERDALLLEHLDAAQRLGRYLHRRHHLARRYGTADDVRSLAVECLLDLLRTFDPAAGKTLAERIRSTLRGDIYAAMEAHLKKWYAPDIDRLYAVAFRGRRAEAKQR